MNGRIAGRGGDGPIVPAEDADLVSYPKVKA